MWRNSIRSLLSLLFSSFSLFHRRSWGEHEYIPDQGKYKIVSITPRLGFVLFKLKSDGQIEWKKIIFQPSRPIPQISSRSLRSVVIKYRSMLANFEFNFIQYDIIDGKKRMDKKNPCSSI